MKNIFAVENAVQLDRLRNFAAAYSGKLRDYLTFLQMNYAVQDLPKAIIWTTREIATEDISNIPIPAYTNDFRTVFCPELEVWKNIYLRQLDALNCPGIRDYYETRLTENHVLQILGHEFVHHSEWFPEDEYERGIWFEEGMCEYISRKYFLTDTQFQEAARINALLVSALKEKYGQYPLEDFGAATYAGDYASIFFAYWQSFLAVQKIVEKHNGDIIAVLQKYQRWLACPANQSLARFFGVEI